MNNMDKLYVDLSEILEASQEELRNNLKMEESEVWDSLKHMELIAMIESNYNVNLTVDEIIKMTSINEITKVLSERI